MNKFAQSARYLGTLTRTENNAVALNTTGNSLVDLFATVGALRGTDSSRISGMFREALQEDKLLATKLMFYARNIRGGLGERDTFRQMLTTLAESNPDIVIKNMELIPLFGRYDDLYALVGTPVEKQMWEFIKQVFFADLKAKELGLSVSLCAKWLKSPNASSQETVKLGRLTARNLGMSERIYRKALSSLRAYIDVTERKMSSNKWATIKYSQVPSGSMKKNRNAFKNHDAIGFANFIGNVQKGTEKVNASTLYPYDILIAAHLHPQTYWGHGYNSRTDNFVIDDDALLEAQWKALPNYVKGENNVLVMSDTSGSMESPYGIPMATSIGLAVYFAERNKGAFKDLFLTFSQNPEFVNLRGTTLKEKVSCIKSIVANTDLEAAFELILKVARKEAITQEEMPKSLIVISDMQFDEARGRNDDITFFDAMKRKFADNGYTMPTVIFWQVNKTGTFQTHSKGENVILVSGHSVATFKSVISCVGRNPYDFMLEVLNDEMYSMVKV